MTIEVLGAWGEFIGGIAVLVTVAYLAFQTRQNTKQIEQSLKLHSSAMATAHTAGFQNFWSTLASDKELAELWHRSQTSSDFTADELVRLGALYFIFTLAFENLILQLQNTSMGNLLGVLPDEHDEVLEGVVLSYLGTDVAIQWWENESTFGPIVRTVIDRAHEQFKEHRSDDA